jgi:hypothetical protein
MTPRFRYSDRIPLVQAMRLRTLPHENHANKAVIFITIKIAKMPPFVSFRAYPTDSNSAPPVAAAIGVNSVTSALAPHLTRSNGPSTD